ncbi:MAG: macrocin-O-methyltransferase TylF [Dehalococcoidia bacterium]|nr:macrocin-O-methyltransferase TylF [Dehalococcoidia bacterium]
MVKLWVRDVSVLPFMSKSARVINNLLISTAGVKIVNANEFAVSGVWINRLIHFAKLLEMVKDVEGDVVECGVGWGKSLAILGLLVKHSDMSRNLWGFDSFEGLPHPTDEDSPESSRYAKQRMFGEATERAVVTNLSAVGLDDEFLQSRVSLVKGWFSETLPSYGGSTIALLHIDADLYESYKTTLENLWPKVAIGGIVAFDEYHLRMWPGAKKAVDEFFADRPGSIEMLKSTVSSHRYVVRLRRVSLSGINSSGREEQALDVAHTAVHGRHH